MKVYVDGDGCPVTRETARICKEYDVECIIICDTSHMINIENVKTVIVEKGSDSADFKLVNLISKEDIAVTQDYALAAMCLARGARAINQDGKEYTDDNINMLLTSRYENKKERMAGKHIKGPRKRVQGQTENFINKLREILKGCDKNENNCSY